MNNSIYIADLIVKEIRGSISSKERVELETWINQSDQNIAIYRKAKNHQNQLNKLEVYQLFDTNQAWNKLEKELFETKTVSLFPSTFIKYAAAVLLPLLVIGGMGYLFLKEQNTEKLASQNVVIKPGAQKAILVSSNGKEIELGEKNTFSDFTETDVTITDDQSRLTYAASESISEFKRAVYNKLVTPLGGGYNLKLADGTEVWLNAGSTLSFPVSFTDSTRQVFLSGEAYFDVAHNGQPFIVTSDDIDIRVMGTAFNVSAYFDDIDVKTTLVEGKVRIDYSYEEITKSEILLPNKQAVIEKNGTEIMIADVDVELYTSWVQGKFEFKNEPLESVLKRLSRWYNFQYEFENPQAKNYHFSGRLNNQEDISNILKMMEMTTQVKFKIIENKIVVQ